MYISISPRELQFLIQMANPPGQVFGVEEAVGIYGSRLAARKGLYRLRKKGLVESLERNRYILIPLEAGPDRLWSEDSLVVGSHLVAQSTIAYWTALHYWGLTEQIPPRVYVQTLARRFDPRPVLAGVPYQFIRISPGKCYGQIIQFSGDRPFNVTNLEKSLVDALDRPELCGGFPVVLQAFREARPGEPLLLEYLQRFPSAGPLRRLGYLAEAGQITISRSLIDQLRSAVPSGVIKLDPDLPRRGRIHTRWGVQDNLHQDIQ